jgi:hypothetical protein
MYEYWSGCMMATYYISPTGNNGNSGTYASPWATLAYAYTNSTTDDTIFFMNGTHTWLTQTILNRTLQGEGATTTIIDAGGLTAYKTWNMSNVHIYDMTFTNNGSTSYNSLLQGATANALYLFDFTRCIFHNLANWGQPADYCWGIMGPQSKAQNGTAGITCTGCIFYDIKPTAGANYGCIYGSTVNLGAPAEIGYFKCLKCVFYLDTTGASRVQNICYSWASGYYTANFKDCIVYNASGGVCVWSSAAVPLTATNCCGVNMTTGGMTGTGNITTDPQFIEPVTARNFKLKPTSPCIGIGTLI